MPVTLLADEIAPLLIAGRRGDIETLEKQITELADSYGVGNGEVLIAAKDEKGTILHAASELGLTGMRRTSPHNLSILPNSS